MDNTYIDTSLTPESCEEKGYEYITDILYDPATANKDNKDFTYALHHGSKLGTPRKIGDASEHIKKMLYGFYEPLTKEKLFVRKIAIEKTLTAKNAKAKGYEWVKDVLFFYDLEDRSDRKVIKYIKSGYKLGVPSGQDTVFEDEPVFGLYKPL